MFKKKVVVKNFSEKITKRIARIPTVELETWAENSLSEIGRSLSGYHKNRNDVTLEEALTGAEVLHAILEELKERTSKR
jgi:hypothetical protein